MILDLSSPYCGDHRIPLTNWLFILSAVMESAEMTKDCNLRTPELSTNQCIFYPVKEEENEVLLCGPQSSSDNTGTEIFHNNMQANLQEKDIHSGVCDKYKALLKELYLIVSNL